MWQGCRIESADYGTGVLHSFLTHSDLAVLLSPLLKLTTPARNGNPVVAGLPVLTDGLIPVAGGTS